MGFDNDDERHFYLREGTAIERSIVVDDDRSVMSTMIERSGIEVLGASYRVALKGIAVRFHLQDRWDALSKIEEPASAGSSGPSSVNGVLVAAPATPVSFPGHRQQGRSRA